MANDQDFTPVGGNGGLPSDMLTSPRVGHRRLKVSDDSLKSAYGESLIVESEPVIQVSAEYGFSDGILTAELGGTTTAADGLYSVASGTGANNAAAIVSYREIRQRAGQGISALLSAAFTQGQANSTQKAGFISSESDFTFGYDGEEFGIFYSKNGALEIQRLTITTAATAVESATITVDGIAHSVNLTNSTSSQNAFDIANQLNLLDGRYRFTSNGNVVEAIANLPDFGAGTWSFSSGTAAGSWLEVANGTIPTETFYPKSEWNVDKYIDIDPTKLNKYKIQLQGNIYFYIEHPETGNMTEVHAIHYLNTSVEPSIINPTFRVGWAVRNTGNTTNLTVKADEGAAFVEGMIKYNQLSTSVNNFSSAGTTATNVVALRNRTIFRDKPNRVEAIPLVLSFGTDYGKPVFFEVIANPTVAAGTKFDWTYLDEQNSIMEVAKNNVVVTGGTVVQSFTVLASKDVDIGKIIGFHSPNGTFAITARIQSSASNVCAVSAVWKEDK